MASSNVAYYERQKELQDTIGTCEQQRMELDRQLRLALQADQTSSKMKATRLNTYWKKICEDERKAKQRNEMMMREFERIDAHMAEMNARTQRLALVKKQYEDYICRTYPKWNEMMHGSPSSSEQQNQQMQPQQEPQHQKEHQRGQHQQQQQQLQQRLSPPDSPIESKHQDKEIENYRYSSDTNQQQGQHVSERVLQQQQEQHQQSIEVEDEYEVPLPYKQQSKNAVTPQRSNGSQHRHYSDTPESPQFEPNSEERVSEYANLPGPAQLPQNFEEKNTLATQHQQQQQHQNNSKQLHHEISNGNVMSGDEDAAETSEFGSDTDIPMGQSLGNTQVRVNAQPAETKEANTFSSPIKPELTADGLFHLLHLVEADLPHAFSLEGYYRSSWPDNATKTNIIRLANSKDDLSRVDVCLVSMVVLEQITLIVRNLSEGSLLPSGLLQGNVQSLTAERLRQHLSPEAQIIWDALISHFVALIKADAMEPLELSAIFTPSMVADGGDQEKGHSFIVQVIEQLCNSHNRTAGGFGGNSSQPMTGTGWNGISPKSTLEGSGSFIDDGRETEAYKNMISGSVKSAPPRQMSSGPEDTDDDVEKQVATAIATKPVAPVTPRTARGEDRSETSSQTATVQTPSQAYVPTAMETRQPSIQQTNPLQTSQTRFQGVRISSDLDTDTEVDVGIFGSSRKQEDTDFDFYD